MTCRSILPCPGSSRRPSGLHFLVLVGLGVYCALIAGLYLGWGFGVPGYTGLGFGLHLELRVSGLSRGICGCCREYLQGVF